MSNRLVVCPYDEAHKVKESRIQLHITKCRLNNTDLPTFICPFNATHVYPVIEKTYHLTRCPDRGVIERIVSAPVYQNNPFKGRTAVPSYSEPIPADTDEVWDVEGTEDVTPVSERTKEAPMGAIVQPEPLSKPASRRQLYRDLHQMPSDIDKRSDVATVNPPIPRQPKQPSQAERNFEVQDTNLQHLGLGRGRPQPPSNRIAANIFARPSEVSSSKPVQSNYSAVISGMNNMGLGRGVSNRAPTNQPLLNEDDFPALGVGRGVPKNSQRQGFKASGSRW